MYISSCLRQVQVVAQNFVNTERHQSIKRKAFENLMVDSQVISFISVTEPELSSLQLLQTLALQQVSLNKFDWMLESVNEKMKTAILFSLANKQKSKQTKTTTEKMPLNILGPKLFSVHRRVFFLF